MKRPEYVAAAVTAVRQALDGETPDMQKLQSVFSRSGFTTGYFDGCRDGKMFGTRQKEDVVAAKDVLGEFLALTRKEWPSVPLEGVLTAEKDEPVTLAAKDADGHTAFASGDAPLIAQNRPTDEARVRQSMEKTGGTPFFWRHLDVTLEDGLLLPASGLNALRREVLGELERQRAAAKPLAFLPPAPVMKTAPSFGRPKLFARCGAVQLSPALLALCDRVTVPLREIPQALAAGVPAKKLAAEIPRILFEGEASAASSLAEAKRQGVETAWCGNIGAVRLARESGLRITGGWSLNLANTRALCAAKEMGISETEISIETSLARLRRLGAPIPFGVVMYGRLPLMTFRNCPMKAAVGCGTCRQKGQLTDRMGTKFQVSCRSGAPELLNSVPLYLADRLREETPCAFYTLWFTDETPQECASIAAQYAGREPPRPPKEYTRGLFLREVL